MHIFYTSLLTVFLLILSGCSSKESEVQEPIPTVFDSCMIQSVEAPQWVCGDATAQNSEQIFDVGQATISKLGTGFTQKEASAEGKLKLQKQVEELAHEKIVLFIRKAGLSVGEDIDKTFVVLLSKRISLNVIEKSRVSEYWKNYHLNRAYSQVVVKKETFRKVTRKKVLLELREKAVYWEVFKDTNATQVLTQVLEEI